MSRLYLAVRLQIAKISTSAWTALALAGVVLVLAVALLQQQERALRLSGVKTALERDAQSRESLSETDRISRASHEPAERVHSFESMLGSPQQLPSTIQMVFDAARDQGLVLSEGAYSLSQNQQGRYRVYKMDVPVTGAYEQVRDFAERVLLAVPFVALEEIRFRRKSVSTSRVDVNVRLAFYLREGELATASPDSGPVRESGR